MTAFLPACYLHLALGQGVEQTTFAPELPERVAKVSSHNFCTGSNHQGLSTIITRLAGDVRGLPTQGLSAQVFGSGGDAPMTGMQATLFIPVSRV